MSSIPSGASDPTSNTIGDGFDHKAPQGYDLPSPNQQQHATVRLHGPWNGQWAGNVSDIETTDEGYDEQRTEIPQWMNGWSDEQRADFAVQVLLSLPTSMLARVHGQITPYLHRDFIALLPFELAFHILSFVDAPTLCRCACVSTVWNRISSNSRLWRRLYAAQGWPANYKMIEEYLGTTDAYQSIELSQSQSESQKTMDITLENLSNISSPISAVSAGLSIGQRNVQEGVSPEGFNPFSIHRTPEGAPAINWKHLFHQRTLLESNWRRGNYRTLELEGHTECVYCVHFDSTKIISGSRDNSVRIWDIRTGKCLRTLHHHKKSVLCLQIDGPWLVTGSSDTTIAVWELDTGNVVKELVGHEDSVLNLCFDSNHIVSSSKDKTIRVWDRESGKCIRRLTGHRAAVNSVQFRDGIVVSASGDRTLKVWDMATGTCLRTLDAHPRGIACVQFDGKTIVSGSSDFTIRVWDAETGACLNILKGHTKLVRTLQFDARRIVSGSYDETIKVWDRKTGKLVSELRGHAGSVFKLQFDERRIVSGSLDKRILVWDFAHDIDSTFLV
ncbi:uncharacterized protein VTP21DRAFT_8911 [Calcarisporiella thermophila]|uniref:uncharacterized protein n=1 Tax=Calcarisporiella thermophila TaxID=911321 RepID=UPI00374317B8